MEIAVSVIADTILITLVLALAAFGLAIVYGLVGVINMGHGAMLTLGAYFTWWLTQHGMPFVPAVLLSAAAVGVVGLLFEHFIIRYFYDRPFDTLLLTWAFFLVGTEVIKIVFGTDIPFGWPVHVDYVIDHPTLTNAEKEQILGGNLMKLLKINT